MAEPDPLGGEPGVVRVIPGDWKSQAAAWIFKQGVVTVILIAWLGWTIYDSAQKDQAKIEAAQARMEFEKGLVKQSEEFQTKIWGRVSDISDKFTVKLKEQSDDFKAVIKDLLAANERKTERDEVRFDKIVDRIKGQ